MTSAIETNRSIPLFDLVIEEEDVAAVEAVYRSGRLGMGREVAAFEQDFAELLGVEHAVAVSSCTAALHLAYLAAGIGPGDEVIVPSITFAATSNAVIYCGGTPVFADVVGPEDPSIDPDDVLRRIGPDTKAVSVVHFAGYPAPIERLAQICEERGIALIEDAAHAPSAALPGGKKLGTFGLAGAFSFFSNKVLPCGEGGLLATDDPEVAALARARREPAVLAGGALGFNYKMDEPRAALLRSRLRRLEADIEDRRHLVRRYRERLASIDGIVVPYRDEDVAASSCYVMPIMLTELGKQGPVRLAMRENHGVQTSLLYPGVHEFSAYQARYPGVSLPRTERVSRTEITLPLFPHMTEEEQDRVLYALETELAAA